MRNSTQVADGFTYILWHPSEVDPFTLFCAALVFLPIVLAYLFALMWTVVDWLKAPRPTPEQIRLGESRRLTFRQWKAAKKQERIEAKKLKRAEDARQRAEARRRALSAHPGPQMPAIEPSASYRELDYPQDGLWHLDRDPLEAGFATAVDANAHARATWPGERFRLLPPIFLAIPPAAETRAKTASEAHEKWLISITIDPVTLERKVSAAGHVGL